MHYIITIYKNHKLTLGKLRMATPLNKKKPITQTEKFNAEVLNHESPKEFYVNQRKQYFGFNPIVQSDTPNKME